MRRFSRLAFDELATGCVAWQTRSPVLEPRCRAGDAACWLAPLPLVGVVHHVDRAVQVAHHESRDVVQFAEVKAAATHRAIVAISIDGKVLGQVVLVVRATQLALFSRRVSCERRERDGRQVANGHLLR